MTDGLKLLTAIAEHGSSVTFRLLEDIYFVDDTELATYRFMNTHIRRYGRLPEVQTIEDAFRYNLPDTPETVDYYLDRVHKRHVYNGVRDRFGDLRNALQNIDIDALVTETEAIRNICKPLRSQRQDIVSIADMQIGIFAEYERLHSHSESMGVPTGSQILNEETGGYHNGDLVILVARPSCLSGKTKVYVSRDSRSGNGRWYTLEELYRGINGLPVKDKGGKKVWDTALSNRTRSLVGDYVQLNGIEDVIQCGIKETYSVTTNTGKQVTATKDHLVLTPYGYREVGDLKVGDKIICTAVRSRKTVKYGRVRKVKEICTKMPYSPYSERVINGCTYNRALEHRVLYDAYYNGMSINEFINSLKAPNSFVFPSIHNAIHHIDGDYTNNAIDNLQVLSHSEHGLLHSKENPDMHKRFRTGITREEEIVSIAYYGEEMTYDMVCQDPYNNYVANGVVVHNCGKSHRIIHDALVAHAAGKAVLFVTMEMTLMQIGFRIASYMAGLDPDLVRKGKLSFLAERRLRLALEEMSSWHNFRLFAGNFNKRISDIHSQIQETAPDIVFIDGLYLMTPDSPAAARANRFERVAYVLDALRAMTLQIDRPIVATTQFSRAAGKDGTKDASMETIGYTDAIATHATLIIGMKPGVSVPKIIREQYQDSNEIADGNIRDNMYPIYRTKMISYHRILEIMKGREGESGTIYTRFRFAPHDFSDCTEYEALGTEPIESPNLDYMDSII